MDDVAASIIDRQSALADFDHARDDFEEALSKVPEEAIDYLPEGDEYSISDLVPHVTGVLERYSRVIDLMREAEYEEVRAVAEPPEAERLAEYWRPKASMKPMERHRGSLDQMEAAHDHLAGQLREMAYEDYIRQGPVIYSGSEEPYGTRAPDILGWVTDHYREHVPQVAQMVESWRKTKQS